MDRRPQIDDALRDLRERAVNGAPLDDLPPALRALALLARGDRDGAHRCVQDESGRDAAWIHAHVHRREGDLENAAYWYTRAGRAGADGDFDEEWAAIAGELLRRPDRPL